MKTASIILICCPFFIFSKSASAGDDIAVFTFNDNREQKVRLVEPSCNIKSIKFYSTSSTTGSNTGPVNRFV